MKNFKKSLVTTIMILCLNYGANAKQIKYLKAEEQNISVAEILRKLNNQDWSEIFKTIEKHEQDLRREPFLKNNSEIRKRLIELLKQGHEFREQKITGPIKNIKGSDNLESFRMQYENKGYDVYLRMLTGLVVSYKDLKTISLVLKTDCAYPSDEITLQTYDSFGKNAIDELIKITHNGSEREKEIAYTILAGWARVSLKPFKDKISIKNTLDENEINKVKEELINGLESKNEMQILYSCGGLIDIGKFTELKNQQEIKKILKTRLTRNQGVVKEKIVGFLGEVGDKNDIEDMNKFLDDNYIDPNVEFERKKQIRATGRTDILSFYPVREAAREAIAKIKARHGLK